ncbi:hypothetical protein OWM07_03555 [Deferribacter thermophilus]|uniref:hypothetical protein n=1 Tax=Deferribacter thermophilus TaxID=53573 RepID=UPI003C2637E9
MSIEFSNLSNIIRTYNRQLKIGKVSDSLGSKSPAKSLDKVTLSPEAMKLLFITDLLAEINSDQITKADIEKLLEGIDFSQLSEEELKNLKQKILENI